MANANYTNTHVDNTKPGNTNQEWLENDESYNIDKLFEEKPDNNRPLDINE